MTISKSAATRKIQAAFRRKRVFINNSGIMTKGSVNVSKEYERIKKRLTNQAVKEQENYNAGRTFWFPSGSPTNANIREVMASEGIARSTVKSADIRFSKTKIVSFMASIDRAIDIPGVLSKAAPGFQQVTGYTHLAGKPQVQYLQGEWHGKTAGIKYIFAKRASVTLRLSREGIIVYGNDKTRIKLIVQRCIMNGWLKEANTPVVFKYLNGTFKMNKKLNLDNLNRFLYSSPLIEGKPSFRSGGKQVIRVPKAASSSSPSSSSANSQNMEHMLNEMYRMMHANNSRRTSPNEEGLNQGYNFEPGYNYEGEEMNHGSSNWKLRQKLRRKAKSNEAKGRGYASPPKPAPSPKNNGNFHVTVNLSEYRNKGKLVEQKRKPRKAREVKTFKSLVFTMKEPKFTFIVFENGTVNFAGLKVDNLELPKEIFKKFFAVVGSANTIFGNYVSKKGKTNSERLAERYRLMAGGNWSRVNSVRVPEGYYIRPGANGKPRLYPYVKFLEGGAMNKVMNLRAVAPKVRKAFNNAGKPIPRVTLNAFRRAGHPLNAPAPNKKVYVKKNISNRRASWNAVKQGHYVLPGPGKQPVFKAIPKVIGKAKNTVIKKYKEAGINIPKSVRNLFGIPANVVTAGNKTHVLTRSNGELKINGKQAKRFKEAELLAIARKLKITGATNKTSKKNLLDLLNKHNKKPAARQASPNEEWVNVV